MSLSKFAGLVLVALALLAAPAMAEHPEKPAAAKDPAAEKAQKIERETKKIQEQPDWKVFNPSMLKGLSLTAEQEAAIKQLKEENGAAVKAWKEQNQAQLEKIKADAKAAQEAGDKEKAKALRDQHSELMKSLPTFEQTYNAILGKLTPEQRELLQKELQAVKTKQLEKAKANIENPQPKAAKAEKAEKTEKPKDK